jgi:hypothetical protein
VAEIWPSAAASQFAGDATDVWVGAVERKKEKILRREQNPLLSVKGAPNQYAVALLRREQKPKLSAKSSSSTRAKYFALGEGLFFNESQIFHSRRRASKYFTLGEGVAPTPNGGAGRDGKTDFSESQGHLSAHIRREGRGKLSAKGASPVNFNVRPSSRASSR